MKKFITFFVFLLALFITGCAAQTSNGQENIILENPTPQVEIMIKDKGPIIVELDGRIAPITVNNFINLVNEGFYDGLTFHRIIGDFMIQGGDPNGDGTGGSGTNITGEFESNGISNPISHLRGVISMARSQDPDSASSQFFIVVEDSQFLDGEYAAFGRVVSGMAVVDQIAEEAEVAGPNGAMAASQQPVIESIRVLD